MKITKIICFFLFIFLMVGCENVIAPTETYKLTIIDEQDFIYDKPKQDEIASGTKITLHANPIMDADLIMFIDGDYYATQKDIETKKGYIWEYSFIMPTKDVTIEFSTDPFHIDKYYYFSDVFKWVKSLNEDTLKAIEVEDGYIGVNPNISPTIRYSEELEDIRYNIKVLNEEPLIKLDDNEIIDGGSYRKIKYITFSGNEYILTISNGRILWESFSSYKYFRFYRTQPNYPDIISDNK